MEAVVSPGSFPLSVSLGTFCTSRKYPSGGQDAPLSPPSGGQLPRQREPSGYTPTGALSWAAEGPVFIRMSGSGAGCREYPDFVRRSIEGRTKGPVSAFLWRSDTVSFGAVKRNGVGKIASQGRSPWYSPFSGAFLVSLCAYKKKLAARRDLAKIMNDLMRDHDV